MYFFKNALENWVGPSTKTNLWPISSKGRVYSWCEERALSAHDGRAERRQTGRDKRPLKIIWNLCQYVINRTRQQFTVGDLSCRAASSVDSITDYNEICFVSQTESLPGLCTYVWGGAIKIGVRDTFGVGACLFWWFQISTLATRNPLPHL